MSGAYRPHHLQAIEGEGMKKYHTPIIEFKELDDPQDMVICRNCGMNKIECRNKPCYRRLYLRYLQLKRENFALGRDR